MAAGHAMMDRAVRQDRLTRELLPASERAMPCCQDDDISIRYNSPARHASIMSFLRITLSEGRIYLRFGY